MDNVNKPTIPAEVADVIECFRNRGGGLPAWSNEAILDHVINSAAPNRRTNALRSIPFDTLLAALVNGYEREQTPEEYVRNLYEGLGREAEFARTIVGSDSGVSADRARRAIECTLSALGIKIEGGEHVMERELTLTNDEIYEFNLWLYDHPQYKLMSWREQVTFWRALRERKEAA